MTRYVLIIAMLASACSESSTSGTEVQICGDLVVPDEIQAVRLTVLNEDRTEAWTGVFELAVLPQADAIPDGGQTQIQVPTGDMGADPVVEDPGVNAGWLGGPCMDSSECGHSRAVCFSDDAGYPRGHCSLECARTCPNRAGTPAVFCIGGLALPDGACVQECDLDALPGNGCRPGYSCVQRSRFDDENVTSRVCLPERIAEPETPPDAGVNVEGDAGVADAGMPLDYAVPEGPTVRATRTLPEGEGNTWIRAQGLNDGVVVVTREIRPSGAATLALTRACRNVTCVVGQTCVSGRCQLVPSGGVCDE
ncbi:MAG: hypothetical protein VYA30_15430 [Myxococcota bacterium]|nr:hypothetical protein [Myxococcota bacterium]